MKLNKVLLIGLCLTILISVFTTETRRSKRIKRNKTKVKSKFFSLNKSYSRFVTRKAGRLTLEDLIIAADKEFGFNDKLRDEVSNSPETDLRITRIRLLQNKEEYGIKLVIPNSLEPKRFTHQSIALCVKSYKKRKSDIQDGIDQKTRAYFFTFERMVQPGPPDIRFQYLGYDTDCRDGVFSTAKNWKVAEMFTLNADMEAAIKIDEANKEKADEKLHEVKKALQEFFEEKIKQQAAWLVGHAALTAAHFTGVGVFVSGPLHVIYGAAHAIHTAVSTTDDIIKALKISKDLALHLKNILDNPYQEKKENDKVKDVPTNNRSLNRFIQAINNYELSRTNDWNLDISDSRTFATGFYNSIKKGHQDGEYVVFKNFIDGAERTRVHHKDYFGS